MASGSSLATNDEKHVGSEADVGALVEVPQASEGYEHLSSTQTDLLRSQIDVHTASVSFFQLFRYATKLDLFLLTIAYVCSIVGGALLPVMSVIFGQLTQTFTDYFVSSGSPQHFQSEINRFSLYYVYLGIGEIAAVAIATFIAADRGQVVSSRIRVHYLEATLRQNVGYFDKIGAGEITTRITADMNSVQGGMSERVSQSIFGLASFFAAFVVGFVKSWRLTLIMSAAVLAMLATNFSLLKYLIAAANKSAEGASVGSSVTEEVFSSVRNVQAYGISDRLAREYDKHLATTEKWSARQGVILSCAVASLWFYVYCNTALGYWQGSRFLVSNDITVSDIVTVMMSMMMGSMAFTQIGPNAGYIATGVATAAKIYAVIDRQSPIDSLSTEGETLEAIEGEIEFHEVSFRYPSRPDVSVLENFNLSVRPGQTVALVGPSGSGKSTIIGLLERFYQPVAGIVTLDGHDITKLNIKWLRQQMSLVSQEPTLFRCSIYENVAFGLIGTPYENAPEPEKRRLVANACEQANALQFIEKLPGGFDTNVGERGFLMSGGQKQRIAIARAIVSNPMILLLDEATSALDTRSEGVVQDALDRAAKTRTTIVIAHRLSTIKDADLIVVMENGKIVEKGTHNELLDKSGLYAEFVNAQRITKLDLELTEGELVGEVEKGMDHIEATAVEDTLGAQSTGSEKRVSSSTKYSLWSSLRMIFGFNRPELGLIVVGFCFSFVCGLSFPIQSVLLAKCVSAFQATPERYGDMRHTINIYSGLFFMLAVVEGIGFIGSMGTLEVVAQKLVRRIRFRSFLQILRQDVAFFDRDENTVGALTSTLAKDAQYIEGLSGATLGQIINSTVCALVGIVISLAIGWKFALVCIACMPAVILSGYFRLSLLLKFEEMTKDSYTESATFACEATGAIRTVAALTREHDILENYSKAVFKQVRLSRAAKYSTSFLYGLTQGLMFLISGLVFWYGGGLLKTHEYTTLQFFIIFVSVIQGAQAAGAVFAFAPDMGKAKQGASSVQNLFESIPVIDAWSSDGLKPETVSGGFIFDDVHFRYPTRLEVPVLQGLSLEVHSGQYVALVGSSGCGKSTIIGLIESFYRPQAGRILLDGVNINELNVSAYRSKIALVQQEPVLYAGTIKYNIALGAQSEVTIAEIQEAAKQANIHDFIMSLPDGYDTLCGSKGVLLSGGQKQRVAIARALIRKPTVLLLDEATSALDSESERLVQGAIDRAAKGRTTIAVAHRLSTIQNADVIYVIDNGRVLESGTHQELLANKAKYYELVTLQALERTS